MVYHKDTLITEVQFTMEKFNGKNIMGILLMALALIAIVFGIIAFCLEDGSYAFTETYGGDAYTGIQNAAADTANNVRDLTRVVRTVGGLGFLLTGFVLFVVGLGNSGLLDKLLSLIKPKAKTAPKAQPTAEVVPATETVVSPDAAPQPIGYDPQTGAPVYANQAQTNNQ